PTSVLGAQELERDRSVSLAHTLSRLPGVRTLSTGGEIGKPVIRGLSGARVLVLDQGLRLEDYAWSDEDGPAVNAALVDRVEVVRGPASVLYGADAVGGVVNVIPRPLPDASGASFASGDAELSAATNNHEAGLVVRGEGVSGSWGWRAAAAGRIAEALHTPLGELENTGFGAFSGEAAAGRQGPWGSFTLRFVQNGGEFKLLEEDGPPAGTEEAALEAGPERKLSDQRLQFLGSFPLDNGTRLETRVQGQRHNIIEMEDDPEALARGEFVEVPVFDLTLTTMVAEALLHHALAPGASGTVGFTGRLQHSRTGGVVPLIPGADQQGAGLFVLERATTGAFTFLGGLRADVARVSPDGHPRRAFNTLTWSAGTAIQVAPEVSLTGNVGTAWRAPTLFELYASGPRLGEARYEIGRDDLGAERSLNVDAGLRWDGPRVRAQLSVYRNDFRDFLFIQPTQEVQDGYQVYRYDQADAVLQGAEASLDVEATSWLSLSTRGDYVRGTNQTRDEPLPLMPPRRFTLGAEVHRAWPTPDGWAYAGGEVETVAQPDRLNPLDLAVDGYTLLNVTAGVRGTWRGREAGVDLRVRNAADVEYRDFLSRYKAFALNPGRDVVLRLRMAF
ncbi:MAG TPA: TonB-dependent receptor, partial [Longimicrobiales bacterium]|nr:TonB-dependent receptor [Longimicrobiales bacterium]